MMGKLKTIYLSLLNRIGKIVRKEEIIELIDEYNKRLNKVSVKNALWYLSRRNYIRRIFLDYYYINSIEERGRGICNYEDREVLFEVLNKEKFKWYIDAFRYGSVVHSGWSIGLERFTMALLKLPNIREATLFPRDRMRLTP